MNSKPSLQVFDPIKHAVVNSQVVKNVSVDDMLFLGKGTRNMLKECGIKTLSDYMEQRDDEPIMQRFLKQGYRLGVESLMELEHIVSYAVWDRIDGEQYYALLSYWDDLAHMICDDMGFLWADYDDRWRRDDFEVFPRIDATLDLSSEEIILLATDVCDARKRTVGAAEKLLFRDPRIQEAYRKHIENIIFWLSIDKKYIATDYCSGSFKTDYGLDSDIPRSFTYIAIRERVICNMKDQKLLIEEILSDLVRAGDLLEGDAENMLPIQKVYVATPQFIGRKEKRYLQMFEHVV